MQGIEQIFDLEKATIGQCKEIAKKIGFDSTTFDLCGPKGKLKAKWIDAHFGLMMQALADVKMAHLGKFLNVMIVGTQLFLKTQATGCHYQTHQFLQTGASPDFAVRHPVKWLSLRLLDR